MSGAHTPGPWHTGGHAGVELVIYDKDGWAVADARTFHNKRSTTEIQANARLIAATPDLLEAVQAAINCIGELSPTQARVEVMQMLTAAAEKATGGEG